MINELHEQIESRMDKSVQTLKRACKIACRKGKSADT